jgi:chromosome segregation ATPase
MSFKAKIEELQENQGRLACGLAEWKAQAEQELRMRQQAEEEMNRLKTTTEKLQRDKQQLEQQVQELALLADHFRSSTLKCYQGVCNVLPILEEMTREGLGGNLVQQQS